MPQGRSPHDAVLIGNKLYVVRGWQLGDENEKWHTTDWVTDLLEDTTTWNPLPTPPFSRRAISLGHLYDKLYVIRARQQEGSPTKRVDVLDLASGEYSIGPGLVDPKTEIEEFGEGMEGFGSSAYHVDHRLFVSTYDDKLQCLAGNA